MQLMTMPGSPTSSGAVLLWLVGVMAGIITARKASVSYVNSAYYGTILEATGWSIDANDVYVSVVTKSTGYCRSACYSDPKCKAVASSGPDGQIVCALSDKGPLDSTLHLNDASTYTFWASTIDGTYYEMMSDNLLYLELRQANTYKIGKKLCDRIPGHRLGIYKTLYYFNSLVEIYKKNTANGIILNLERDPNGKKGRYWGDGPKVVYADANLLTKFKTSYQLETKPMYTFLQDKIRNIEANVAGRIVCQANPLGVNW